MAEVDRALYRPDALDFLESGRYGVGGALVEDRAVIELELNGTMDDLNTLHPGKHERLLGVPAGWRLQSATGGRDFLRLGYRVNSCTLRRIDAEDQT